VAVASAGPYASLHLAPDRQPRQHPTTLFFNRPDALPVGPTNSVKALKAELITGNNNNNSLGIEYQVKNNNNNNYDDVHGAVIMTKVIERVHPVHLMNVD